MTEISGTLKYLHFQPYSEITSCEILCCFKKREFRAILTGVE
jgi:hypothetical protein